MDIEQAKSVLLKTHLAALRGGYRASAFQLVSSPGVGKSDGVSQYELALAKHLNEPVGSTLLMLATILPEDVRGIMMPVEVNVEKAHGFKTVFSTPPWYPVRSNTTVVTPDGKVYLAGTHEGPVPRVGVAFLDEFGQADESVRKPAAELVYQGRVGNVRLPLGWRVIAASNRTSDRSGVSREMMFLVNRRCELQIDPSLRSWVDWASRQEPANRPHHLTMSFAQKNPDIVFAAEVPDDTEPFCTPRSLCMLDRELKALRSQEDQAHDRLPIDNEAREVAAGFLGKGAAAQFFTHLKYADELPDMADVLKHPEKAKVPPNKDAQMVAAYMLAHHVDEATAVPIMTYITRLHIEMQVLAVRAVTAQEDRAAAVMATKPFMDWLMKNKDLIIASRI